MVQFCREKNILPILTDFIPTGRTELGRFVGQASIGRQSTDDQQKIESLLTPPSTQERSKLVVELADIDIEYGFGRPSAFAYYSGVRCTQLLGVYLDIRGNVWPCVARTQGSETEWLTEPLCKLSEELDLLDLWQNSPYLRKVRAEYDGGCPYKPRLASNRLYSIELKRPQFA